MPKHKKIVPITPYPDECVIALPKGIYWDNETPDPFEGQPIGIDEIGLQLALALGQAEKPERVYIDFAQARVSVIFAEQFFESLFPKIIESHQFMPLILRNIDIQKGNRAHLKAALDTTKYCALAEIDHARWEVLGDLSHLEHLILDGAVGLRRFVTAHYLARLFRVAPSSIYSTITRLVELRLLIKQEVPHQERTNRYYGIPESLHLPLTFDIP